MRDLMKEGVQKRTINLFETKDVNLTRYLQDSQFQEGELEDFAMGKV